MKTTLFIAASLLTVSAAMAQNRVNLTLSNGSVESYNTAEVESIEINGPSVTVNPVTGVATTYAGTVTGMSFLRNTTGKVMLAEAGGWFETAYVKWMPMEGVANYHVYVKGENDPSYTRIDWQLVRNYGSYGRADVPGLKAGRYMLKVVPVIGGVPDENAAAETALLEVRAHDRSGFAHLNYGDGVGAYNNDGTLKAGAKVIYVTADNAKTVTADVISGSNNKTTTYTGMQDIIYGYQKGLDHTPITFRVIGRLTFADMDELLSSAEGLQIKGKGAGAGPMNITIEGIGDDATIKGFGFLVRNAESVELSNFAIMDCLDDCVSLDTDNSHIWVHNLDLFYGQTGGDADQAKGDGTVDMKGDSQYITVSYNHFFDAGKSSLCGMKSETGPNWITYHHNWFDHSDSRHPRIRTMSVHIYNNYYDGVAKYGVGATSGADAFVEANYFRDCKYPILTSLQGSDIMGEGSTPNGTGTFSSESGGSIKAYANVMRGWYFYRPWSEDNPIEFDCYEATSRDEKMPATLKAKSGGDTYSNWDTDPALMYAYTPDPAEAVPAIVKGIYGAGRINHGDFKWTFNNATQDKNYDVIPALKAAVQAYDSRLVGFYEGAVKIGNGGVGSANPGGDSSEGPECPFGDGNFAYGGGSAPDDPVEAGDAFIASADGTDFLYCNEANTDAVNALFADGTLMMTGETSSFNPTFFNETYPKFTGAIIIAKSGGTLTVKCPSISKCKFELLRTGTYNYTIERSTDGGTTWETIVSDTKTSKGNLSLDCSAAAACNSEALLRITNKSTGNLNIHAIYILKSK